MGDDIPIVKEISTICGAKIEAVKQSWSMYYMEVRVRYGYILS